MIMNGNQYIEGAILDIPEDEAKMHLKRARQQSLSLIYFMQTEIENGYNNLYFLAFIFKAGNFYSNISSCACIAY